MRRLGPLHIGLRLLAALLVILGAAGPGLASMLCQTPMCPKTAPVVETPKTCCASLGDSREDDSKAKESAPKASKNCCCEIESAPDAVVTDFKMALPASVELPIVLPEPASFISTRAIVAQSLRIPDHSDASPPCGSGSPKQSRAPPRF